MNPRDINEIQGRMLIAAGFADQQTVSKAWKLLAQYPGADLCSVLEQFGQISPQAASRVRFQAQSQQSPAVPPALSPEDSAPTLMGPLDQAMKPGSPSASSLSSVDGVPEIPGYSVIKELGRGGMGVVLLVKQEESDTTCVAKLMLTAEPSDEALARFTREARALAQIRHENIVGIKSFGDVRGVPYFVMEHVEGQDLEKHVQESMKKTGSPPPIDWVLERLLPVAEAIHFIHERGLTHRDLKPANILIEAETERPVLVDFGLAKNRLEESEDGSDSEEALTKTGHVLGTPAFMAPEQMSLSSKDDIEPKSDVWGFAATLYYCLVGEKPYQGATAINIYNQLLKGPPKLLTEVMTEPPSWLSDLCVACFQHDLLLRATMTQVVEVIKQRDALPLDMKAIEEAEAKKARSQRVKRVLLGLLSVVTVGLTVLMIQLPALLKTEFRLSTKAPGEILTESFLRVEGRVDGVEAKHPVEVQLVGGKGQVVKLQKAYVSVAGDFSTMFSDCPSGDYTVRCVVEAEGREKLVSEYAVSLDNEPPKIESYKAELVDGGFLLSGKLSEGRCQVQFRDQTIRSESDTFKFQLARIEDLRNGAFVITDRGGHRVKVTDWRYHVANPQRTLQKTIDRAKDGDVIFVKEGVYKENVVIQRPLSLVGVGPENLTVRAEKSLRDRIKKKTIPWPVVYGKEKPALTVRLPQEKATETVVLKGLGFVQDISDRARTERMNREIRTHDEIDKERDRIFAEEKRLITAGELVYTMTEDEAFKSERCHETCLKIEGGTVEMEACAFESYGFMLIFCAAKRAGLAPSEIKAQGCLFMRHSMQGVIMLSSSGQFRKCQFLGFIDWKTEQWRRNADRPFLFKYCSLLGYWNNATGRAVDCTFEHSYDRFVFVGQKKGHFPKLKSSVELTGCSMSTARREGIYVGWTGVLTMTGCTIKKTYEEGVYANSMFSQLTVIDSTITETGTGSPDEPKKLFGILVKNSSAKQLIKNTKSFNNGGGGIDFRGLGKGELLAEKCKFLGAGVVVTVTGGKSTFIECDIQSKSKIALRTTIPEHSPSMTLKDCTLQGQVAYPRK